MLLQAQFIAAACERHRISPIYAPTVLLWHSYKALSLVLRVWKVKEKQEKL